MPRGADRRLESALADVGRALAEQPAEWMVIGGIAIIARGVRRATTDIDVAVRGDAVGIRALVDVMHEHGIVPRIDGAEAFARRNLVLLLRHAATGVDIDLSLAWSGFEHEALRARVDTAFGKVVVPMASPEDLVVLKAVAARPRDVEDIAALLSLYPKLDLRKARRRVADFEELAGTDVMVAALERAIAIARPRKTRARKPR